MPLLLVTILQSARYGSGGRWSRNRVKLGGEKEKMLTNYDKYPAHAFGAEATDANAVIRPSSSNCKENSNHIRLDTFPHRR